MRPAARITITCALALAGACAAYALDPAKLRAAYQRFVEGAPLDRFASWLDLVGTLPKRQESERVVRANAYFNAHIRFVDDVDLYGLSDYWATPMETLARGAGDCEDFAIAKYFTLLEAGVPVEKLRLTYVRARVGTAFQAHMVLAYYPNPDADPLIMDNLVSTVLPASSRPDLLPVFNFNSQRVYQVGAGSAASTSISRLSRWEDALRRARNEGFD